MTSSDYKYYFFYNTDGEIYKVYLQKALFTIPLSKVNEPIKRGWWIFTSYKDDYKTYIKNNIFAEDGISYTTSSDPGPVLDYTL